jgi:hypothetical protein
LLKNSGVRYLKLSKAVNTLTNIMKFENDINLRKIDKNEEEIKYNQSAFEIQTEKEKRKSV